MAGLYQLYMMIVYLGIVNFPIDSERFGDMSFQDPQWGAALWALLLIAAIWIWVAMGFWNLRAYAVQFGLFDQPVHADLGLLRPAVRQLGRGFHDPLTLAGFIYLYLSYPGVQQAFVENEEVQALRPSRSLPSSSSKPRTWQPMPSPRPG